MLKEKSEPLAYSIRQVCDATSLGRTTIFQAIASGKLKTIKINRRRLVTPAALKAWLNSFPTKTAGEATSKDEI